ncbi:S8 family peptidase [Fusibacter sp. JL298sf-3]
MRKIGLLSLILCLVLSSMSFASGPIVFPQENNSKTELIVSVEPANGLSLRSSMAESAAGSFVIKDAVFEEVSTRGLFDDAVALKSKPEGNIYLVSYSKNEYRDFESAKAGVTAYFENQGYRVKSVDRNDEMRAIGYPAYDFRTAASIHNLQKPHYDLINLTQAWAMSTGSYDVKVAVLDTGIDHNHVSLKNHVDTSLGKNFTTSNPADTMDRRGHGTHVAGTIGAYGGLSGVMQQVTLIPVKVLGDGGTGDSFWGIKGIYHAVAQGADVINMSLGGGRYVQAYSDACDYAVQQGVVVVAATGNDSRNSISYPAKYASTIAVGNIDVNKQRWGTSNYGDGLEIMAPGRNVLSTTPNNKYARYTGTSMATPHVAGIVGLMVAANPNITPNEVRQILRNTAENVGPAWEYGYGLVDAEAAVREALK